MDERIKRMKMKKQNEDGEIVENSKWKSSKKRLEEQQERSQ